MTLKGRKRIELRGQIPLHLKVYLVHAAVQYQMEERELQRHPEHELNELKNMVVFQKVC